MILRDYQQRAFESVRESIRRGNRSVVLVAPTGSGKTVMGAALAALIAYLEGALCFVVPIMVELGDAEERVEKLEGELDDARHENERLRALLTRAGIDPDSAAARMAGESLTLPVAGA